MRQRNGSIMTPMRQADRTRGPTSTAVEGVRFGQPGCRRCARRPGPTNCWRRGRPLSDGLYRWRNASWNVISNAAKARDTVSRPCCSCAGRWMPRDAPPRCCNWIRRVRRRGGRGGFDFGAPRLSEQNRPLEAFGDRSSRSGSAGTDSYRRAPASIGKSPSVFGKDRCGP